MAEQRPIRRYRRRTVRVGVEYESDKETRRDTATTLGAGGLFIPTSAPLDEGTPLTLRFRLWPHGRMHKLRGRVVWSNYPDAGPAYGMGIQFDDRGGIARLARELETLADRNLEGPSEL